MMYLLNDSVLQCSNFRWGAGVGLTVFSYLCTNGYAKQLGKLTPCGGCWIRLHHLFRQLTQSRWHRSYSFESQPYLHRCEHPSVACKWESGKQQNKKHQRNVHTILRLTWTSLCDSVKSTARILWQQFCKQIILTARDINVTFIAPIFFPR